MHAHPCFSNVEIDGSPVLTHALSELYILQETAGRWAFSKELDFCGEEVRPVDMFDIIGGTGIGGFYAVLFVSLRMTIEQAIQSHGILERQLFSSELSLGLRCLWIHLLKRKVPWQNGACYSLY
ncbi:hypothetical protein DL96DRAFT_1622785 [Flagelloscypha sp. PMI_526]|nr:hypothetical protein DL96DRAFT_1622785 [Flagelloscypha sp. PMI_526]